MQLLTPRFYFNSSYFIKEKYNIGNNPDYLKTIPAIQMIHGIIIPIHYSVRSLFILERK